jgi:hypothetical protein
MACPLPAEADISAKEADSRFDRANIDRIDIPHCSDPLTDSRQCVMLSWTPRLAAAHVIRPTGTVRVHIADRRCGSR